MLKKSKEHLDFVDESYWQHLSFAFWFAGRLICAGAAVIVHALCPALCQDTGSRTVFALYDVLKSRNARSAPLHDA